MCPGRDPGHPRLPLAAAVVVFLPLVELLRWLRAIRAFAHEAFSVVRRRPHIGGLQLQLANVRIDDREALLAQHHTIGQPQPIDLALSAAGPRTQVSDFERPTSIATTRMLWIAVHSFSLYNDP